MKYIYLDRQGDPVGPVDESAVVQAIRDGVLSADSPIRNALLREFYTVADFDCFAEVLAQTAQSPEDRGMQKKTGSSIWRDFAELAREKDQEAETNAIAGKLHPGDASVSRRVLAMLLDGIVLAPALLFFLPALAGLKDLGTRDDAEIARVQNARKAYRTAVRRAELDRERESREAERRQRQKIRRAEMEKGAQTHALGDTGIPQHSTRRALVDRVAPTALKKLDRAYAMHNEAVERAAQDKPAAAAKKPARPKKTDDKSLAAGLSPAKTGAVPAAGSEVPETPVPPNFHFRQLEDPPQAVLFNMPGGMRLAEAMPRTAEELEVQYFNMVREQPAGKKTGFSLRNLLITGCSLDRDAITLRIAGDVRKIPRAEFRRHCAAPLKWTVLTVLLYYTLAFSIFAQTVGMWFWGIFLTRRKVAEVLPLRALAYTVCMLIFGVLMIPMVLITRRSLADWLCGVRQIGVGSVSKS